jgi:hypothetical protein
MAAPIMFHVKAQADRDARSAAGIARLFYALPGPTPRLRIRPAQPIVPPPMHALRLLRKRPCYALTTSQAHLDFSRRGNPSFAHRFLLASIGQAAAVATRKHIAGVVNLCDPPSTIPPVGIDRASEPGASATEVAFGPCDWNALPNIFPFGRAVRARTVDEHDSVMLGQNPNVARRFIIPGPRPIKPQSRPQQVLPVQLPNVEGVAAFARCLDAARILGHCDDDRWSDNHREAR